MGEGVAVFVEVEQFALVEGTSYEAFRRIDADVQAWSHLHRHGVLRRTTAMREDGEVLVVTLLGGAEPPAAPDPAAAGADAVAALVAAIDESSYRRSVYQDLG